MKEETELTRKHERALRRSVRRAAGRWEGLCAPPKQRLLESERARECP